MLDWCRKCKNKCTTPGKMNISCLACKWQYPGQSCFNTKEDLFVDDVENTEDETPYEYWEGCEFALQMAGSEVI